MTECCVCLDFNNHASTTLNCCKNKIHSVCLAEIILSDARLCPLCRENIQGILSMKQLKDIVKASKSKSLDKKLNNFENLDANKNYEFRFFCCIICLFILSAVIGLVVCSF